MQRYIVLTVKDTLPLTLERDGGGMTTENFKILKQDISVILKASSI